MINSPHLICLENIDYLNKIGPDVLKISTKQLRIIIDKSKKSKLLIKDLVNSPYFYSIIILCFT